MENMNTFFSTIFGMYIRRWIFVHNIWLTIFIDPRKMDIVDLLLLGPPTQYGHFSQSVKDHILGVLLLYLPHMKDRVSRIHVNTYLKIIDRDSIKFWVMLLFQKLSDICTYILTNDLLNCRGGVYPPGYALAKTEFLEELCSGNYGLEFDII